MKKQKKLFFIFLLLLLAPPLAWLGAKSQNEYPYDLMKSYVIDWNYYFGDATTVASHNRVNGKHSVEFDIHMQIDKERLQRLLTRNTVFYDCWPKKEGCPDPTWQSYDYYVSSYGTSYSRINYEGRAEERYNNPAVPNLANNPDKEQIRCTMHQRNYKSAYGLCANPNTGDVWYHYYD